MTDFSCWQLSFGAYLLVRIFLLTPFSRSELLTFNAFCVGRQLHHLLAVTTHQYHGIRDQCQFPESHRQGGTLPALPPEESRSLKSIKKYHIVMTAPAIVVLVHYKMQWVGTMWSFLILRNKAVS